MKIEGRDRRGETAGRTEAGSDACVAIREIKHAETPG